MNPIDAIVFYGIPGLFGSGTVRFKDIKTVAVRDDWVAPVTPSCRVTLSLEALEKSNQYMKEQACL